MSFWDGTRWVAADPATLPASSRLTRWAATAVMVIGLAALLIPFNSITAGSHKLDPGCRVSTADASLGQAYTLSAWGLPTGTAINLWVTNANGTTGSPLGGTSDGTFNMNEWSNVAGTVTYTFSGPTKHHTTEYATCSVDVY